MTIGILKINDEQKNPQKQGHMEDSIRKIIPLTTAKKNEESPQHMEMGKKRSHHGIRL